MAKDDIKKHQFQPGQSGNPKGRPPNSFASVNAMLKDEGIMPLKKRELIEAYEIIFNTPEERLKEIAKDKSMPLALRHIINDMNNSKTGQKARQDYRDWCFGRAKESVDHTTNGENINVISLGSGVKPEE